MVMEMNGAIEAINSPINSFVWGPPTVTLIALTGIVLMVGLQFMPLPFSFPFRRWWLPLPFPGDQVRPRKMKWHK